MMYHWGNNRRFNSLSDHYKKKYGSRLQKVSINAGFTCPNRDGTVGTGGCTFCNNEGFSPSYCHDDLSITEQINRGLKFLKVRYKRASLFIAYFQAWSNTYADIDTLRKRYNEALSHPEISGISIGTRPDCVDDEKLDFIKEITANKFVSIEYGVESCYNATLEKINRGHDFESAREAIIKTSIRGIHTGIHLIIGLPGETRNQILRQSEIVSALPIDSIKFHQLQIVKDTAMEKQFLSNPDEFTFWEPDEYVKLMIEFVENLRPSIAIERFSGEVPPGFNMRQSWKGLRSDQILLKIERRFQELNSWQGKNYSARKF